VARLFGTNDMKAHVFMTPTARVGAAIEALSHAVQLFTRFSAAPGSGSVSSFRRVDRRPAGGVMADLHDASRVEKAVEGKDRWVRALGSHRSKAGLLRSPVLKLRPELLLALATIASFLAALVAGEWSLRRYDPDYLFRLHADESSNIYSEVYGWQLRPGFHGHDLGELATISTKGTRGAEHSYNRPPGRTRVVMLGDSIGYGAGVKDEETFSALLETRTGRFDVVNLSVGGYGTDQELIQFEREGVRYHPDVVILSFCLFSDFVDNALPTALFDARQAKPYFTWNGHSLVLHDEHVRLSTARRAIQWLADQSHLFNRLRVIVGLGRPARQPGVWADRMAAVMRDAVKAAELTFRLIARMGEDTRRAGARFVVLVHPDEFAYMHRSHLLHKFCTAPQLEGITVVDLAARYHERGLEFREFALDQPGHLTRLGHQVVTETLETILQGDMPPDWDYRTGCSAQPNASRD
jgi:hypothetical protein